MNRITDNCHLIYNFYLIGNGQDHVKAANNCFVDAVVTGTILCYIHCLNAIHTKIVLKEVLDWPACGMNNLWSLIQEM